MPFRGIWGKRRLGKHRSGNCRGTYELRWSIWNVNTPQSFFPHPSEDNKKSGGKKSFYLFSGQFFCRNEKRSGKISLGTGEQVSLIK
jgi:hypothetical protein